MYFGVYGVVVEVVPLFQQSATSFTNGWTPGTGPHYLPNSHLWLQEVGSAQQQLHPGTHVGSLAKLGEGSTHRGYVYVMEHVRL